MTLDPSPRPDALRPTADDALHAWAARVRADSEQVERLREVQDPADFYGPVAERFRMDPRRTTDTSLNALLEHARPTETWLDIGAGGGRFGLPLALRVRHVTCVEPSPGMVKVLRGGMREHGIENIRIVPERWPLPSTADGRGRRLRTAHVSLMAHVGYDIEAIGPFVDALEATTRRLCIAVMGQGAMTTIATQFWGPIHGEPRIALPALPEFIALLVARGRLPEVRLVERTPPSFDSFEGLMAMARRQLWVKPDGERDDQLRQLVRDRARRRDGRWIMEEAAASIGIVAWAPPASIVSRSRRPRRAAG